MESSFGLVFRALVMLACLAVVPLVAMYGKYVPDFAQAVMEAYKARTQAKTEVDPRTAAGGDAPPFAGAASQTSTAAPLAAGTQSPAGAPSAVGDRGHGATPLSEWPRSSGSDAADNAGLKRASYDSPVGGQTAGSTDSALRPAGAAAPTPAPGTLGSDSSATAAQDCSTQFRRMEQRLRELGATYYLLETWGSTGDRYRFFCKMAIAGNADYNRNRIFQATAADPLRAMQDVLEQVEQWRAGRQ